MSIDREKAFKLWDAIYGTETAVQDCFGTYMYRDDYGDRQKRRKAKNGEYYYYGWELDHILPESLGGTDMNNNLEPMNWQNNLEKADKTVFSINGESYRLYRCTIGKDGYSGYGIVSDKTKQRVDWKAQLNKHF